MLFIAIFVTGMSFPLIILFREKPDRYPSRLAKEKAKIEFNVKEDFKKLLKNKDFMLLTFSFSCIHGV